MNPRPTFIDRLLHRDPLAGLLADLNRVLNAREPACGAPDLSLMESLDFTNEDDLKKIAKQIAKVIQHHDPRIVRVLVEVSKTGVVPHFEMTIEFVAMIQPVCLKAIHSKQLWQVRNGDVRK